MHKDFTITEELKTKIIDFLYEIKSNSRGWIREEAVELLTQLKGEQE